MTVYWHLRPGTWDWSPEGIGRMMVVDICRSFLNVASLCIHAGELGVRRSSTHHVLVI